MLLLVELIPNAINWSTVSEKWGCWLWIPWAVYMVGQLLRVLRVFVPGVIFGESDTRQVRMSLTIRWRSVRSEPVEQAPAHSLHRQS